MKKLFTLTVITALTLAVYAQSPQKMSYQGVVRNASGILVANHAVGMRISILQGSATGTVVFSETYTPVPQSNGNGLVTVEIGSGTATVGSLAGIDWSAAPYFMKTETDPNGATDYSVVGTSQLLSVPYSLYSKSAESIPDGSVTSAKIADGTITAIDIQDRERNISFPANALNFDKASTVISQSYGGLAWKSNGDVEVSLTIIKPLDWVETSNITIKLYFRTAGIASSGIVSFFIRPRAFNEGDDLSDALGISPVSTVNIPGGSGWKIYSQSFIIPYNNLRTKKLWELTIQRDIIKETFKQEVVLMAVELIYTANQ